MPPIIPGLEKKFKPNTEQPKKSLLRDLFGHNPLMVPELEETWNKIQRERPNEEGLVNAIVPMNPITKFFSGNPQAQMWPSLGIMEVNRDLMKEANPKEVMSHELGHAQQGVTGFLRSIYDPYIKDKPWYQKFRNTEELENEAYDAEEKTRETERNRKSVIRNAALARK